MKEARYIQEILFKLERICRAVIILDADYNKEKLLYNLVNLIINVDKFSIIEEAFKIILKLNDGNNFITENLIISEKFYTIFEYANVVLNMCSEGIQKDTNEKIILYLLQLLSVFGLHSEFNEDLRIFMLSEQAQQFFERVFDYGNQ